MAEVAVVTAVYGDYPPPRPLPVQVPPVAEQILVTDRDRSVAGWRTVIEPRSHLTARAAAKIPKCRPDLYTDAPVTVWLDAQVQVRSPGLVAWLAGLATAEPDRPVALFRHPTRTSLTAEAAAGLGSEGRGRFAGQSSQAQSAAYLAAGHPDDWGLWCGGIIARRAEPGTARFGSVWLDEIIRWSAHDQVALPWALRATVGRPVDVPWPGCDNPRFRLIDPRRAR